jgi:3-oxoacyl-[acyl-carrier-protein] synthase-1
MKRAVVTGLGFITSIGNSRAEVTASLKAGRHGIEVSPEFTAINAPVSLVGSIKGFEFPSADFEDWTYPPNHKIARETLRPMSPNSLYAWFAMKEAIADAALPPELVSHEDTGLMCASGGSMWMAYENLHLMVTKGVQRCPPMGIINGIPGSLYVNLVPAFKIKGASLGFSSACASSAHSLGEALDLIRDGRQKIVLVAGAEDCNKFNILPFAGIRALSPQSDPDLAPRAFDKHRDGFVGTGGATVLVVEELEHARQRSAPTIYAEVTGWGQASDGHNVLAPDPSGDGLSRAMKLALADAKIGPGDVDYLNAHATATEFGDRAEIEAIKKAFPEGQRPLVSSTKSLTGHGLSLAGAMESAFCCVALHEKFTPISAKISELDPMCDGVPIIKDPIDHEPKIALNNSSGFGGANVAIVLQRWDSDASAN